MQHNFDLHDHNGQYLILKMKVNLPVRYDLPKMLFFFAFLCDRACTFYNRTVLYTE